MLYCNYSGVYSVLCELLYWNWTFCIWVVFEHSSLILLDHNKASLSFLPVSVFQLVVRLAETHSIWIHDHQSFTLHQHYMLLDVYWPHYKCFTRVSNLKVTPTVDASQISAKYVSRYRSMNKIKNNTQHPPTTWFSWYWASGVSWCSMKSSALETQYWKNIPIILYFLLGCRKITQHRIGSLCVSGIQCGNRVKIWALSEDWISDIMLAIEISPNSLPWTINASLEAHVPCVQLTGVRFYVQTIKKADRKGGSTAASHSATVLKWFPD